jgi:hypothetical protein
MKYVAPIIRSDMESSNTISIPRRQRIRLGLTAAGLLLLAGCTGNQYPTTPPDPRDPNLTWAQKHYIKKMQYQQITHDRLP